MTEKELRKLHRHDLLELLVEQSREAARLGAALKEKEEELTASGRKGRGDSGKDSRHRRDAGAPESQAE